MSQAPLGKLYLVPTPLDFLCATQVPLNHVLPVGTVRAASQIDHWIGENAKSTRAFLKRIDLELALKTPLQAQTITELPRQVHKKGDLKAGGDMRPLLQAALQGHDIGLLSEAGMPAVADPGSSVVRAAHDLGLQVLPLVGPSALLLALAASGLNGQQFAFLGYLPQDAAERDTRLKALEKHALKTGETQVFIETPYRNAAMLSGLLGSLQASTRLAVCSHLTLPEMRIQSHSVADWKRHPDAPDKNTPAVFAFGP
ncbi:MAG: SAM-dependent methyltransferase [Limnohabitans sp.]|jgi:16S rRNA (cytidine1402-2'-O)-methyltransferase|nr:SAM-dependent methyltransferase [Limnohabitans sp.]MBP8021439.1 SAM-dependent methyltransferase [Limnohabitans sp.]